MASLEAFLASPEATALDVDAPAREAVARRLFHSLQAVGVPLEKLGSSDAHGWLLHALPDEFQPRDPLAPAIAAVLGALFDFTERTQSRKLTALRAVCEEMLPDLEEAVRTGHAHHHHHQHDHDHEPETPYVRASPKVGRNDPCPCGSGKKFKKCHGA